MSQFVEGPRKSFTAGSILEPFRRVKVTAATGAHGPTVGYAGVSDPCIGVTEAYVPSGDPVTVYLANAQGTRKMSATAAAITANNPVYAAANGQVAATGTIIEGKALETTAGAAGDILEVLPVHNSDIATSISGTTAATFEADSDLGKPRAALGSQTGGTGDFKAVIRPPATLGADRVFTLDGDANATIANVATAQTLTNKTLASPIITGLTTNSNTTTPVAAAGTTVADAGALPSTRVSHITSDGTTKGVVLPAVTAGGVEIIVVNDSATAAELYAESTGTVNGLAADASVVIPASKGVLCISTAAKTWKVFDLPAAATAS